MVPGIGYDFKCFLGTLAVIEELKSSCGGSYRGGSVIVLPFKGSVVLLLLQGWT